MVPFSLALQPSAMGTHFFQNDDPILSEMGAFASRMGIPKAHVCIIDGNKLIRRNKAFKRRGKIIHISSLPELSSLVVVVLPQVIKILT